MNTPRKGKQGTSEGRARDDARVQPQQAADGVVVGAGLRPRWTRSGPLPVDVQEKLAGGFGTRVRELRAAAGWSQRRLAEVIGCDARTVGRLERGEHRPTRQQVAWLARAFTPAGVDPFPLDFELLDLVGENRRHRRRGSRSGLYDLPGDIGRELAQVDRLLSRARRQLHGRVVGTLPVFPPPPARPPSD